MDAGEVPVPISEPCRFLWREDTLPHESEQRQLRILRKGLSSNGIPPGRWNLRAAVFFKVEYWQTNHRI